MRRMRGRGETNAPNRPPDPVRGFRLPIQSLMAPENNLVICDAASATASIKPAENASYPSTETMNTG